MRSYKVEVLLSDEQKHIYSRTVGACRYVYNLFIETNISRYKAEENYMNNYDFSKWLNNVYAKEFPWIKDVSSKAVRNTIDNAHKAYQKFFGKQGKFPRFKKKGKNDCNYYFVRTSKSQQIKCERHRIKVPCLGWVRLREYGYIPTNGSITSGTISCRAGRYYVSVVTDEVVEQKQRNGNDGIGIDLGVKDFAILNDGTKYETLKQKKLHKRLKKEQRKLSRKYEANKTKIKKGESTKGIERQKMIVARLHQKIADTRNDYQNKVISDLMKREPSFITIENLNVRGMMKNRHLSKAIASQSFTSFVEKLKHKSSENGIEVRVVDRFYPSSKLCNACGLIKSDLKLKDRIYVCECGYSEDRDVNAAKNLKDATTYKVA